MARFYTTPTGERYPLSESQYPMSFRIYKSDRKKARPGDPNHCLLALGIMRNRDVLDVYIGGGIDAYVVFKKTADEPARAVHFALRATARKLIDNFDKDTKSQTTVLELGKPPHSWTLDGRKQLNARRRAAIKNGSAVKKQSGPRNKARMSRLGVANRRKASVTRGGNLNASA